MKRELQPCVLALLLAAAPLLAQEAPPAPEPAPAPATEQASGRDQPFLFQFDSMPYEDVIRQFAQHAGKPIIGGVDITGELTFFDSRPYTYDEALETLNIILSMQGQMLVESERHFKLVMLGDISQIPVKLLPGGLDEPGDVKPGDLVTVFLPVKEIGAEQAAKAVVPMVSLAGKIAPLEKAGGILITDRLDSIQRIRNLLRMIDQTSQLEREQQLKSFVLKRASAANAATVVNTLLKQAAAAQGAQSKRQGVSSITAAADVRSNVVMLYGTTDMLVMADELITMLDGENADAGSNIRSFGLKTAFAPDVANSLLQLFGGKSGAQGTLIHGDGATNTILVKAGFDEMRSIEQAIQKLDENVQKLSSVKVYPLKRAAASSLAVVVQSVLVRRGASGQPIPTGSVTATADDNTNTLYLTGPPDMLEQADVIIADLDRDSPTSQRDIRVVTLQHANPAELAPVLQLIANAGQPKGRAASAPIVVSPMPHNNAVVIAANEADQDRLATLISTLDVEEASKPEDPIQVIRLQTADATALARMLATTIKIDPRNPIAIQADAASNTLLIRAPKSQRAMIEQVIAQLDEKTREGAREMRTLNLQHASAAALTPMLSQLYSPTAAAARRGARAEPTDAVIIAPAPNDKALVVDAPRNLIEDIDALVRSMDSQESLPSGTKAFRLKYADANQVAGMLLAMLGEDPRRRATPSPIPTRVGALIASNDVIVQGSPDALALAEELIASIDTDDAQGQTTLEVVLLENAQAQSLAAAVTQLLSARYDPRTRQGQQIVTVTPEPNSNSVLVRGPADQVPEVVEMIRRLDSHSDAGGARIRIFPVKNGDVEELARSLDSMFRGMSYYQSQRNRGAPATPFIVTPDPRTNSLVVSTSEAYFVMVEELLASLDHAPERIDRDVRYFSLLNADSYDVSSQLEDLYAARRPDDKPVIQEDFGANAISVIAKADDMATIESVIRKLDDAAEDHSIQVRVIPLDPKKDSAAKLATALKRIYEKTNGGQVILDEKKPATPLPPETNSGHGEDDELHVSFIEVEPPAAEPAPPAEQPAEPTEAQPAPQPETIPPPPVHIGVDEETNSLILSGTRKQLDELEELIDKFRVGATQDPDADFRVIQLVHAEAEAVADIINALFNPSRAAAAQGANELQQQLQQQIQQQLQNQAQNIPGMPGMMQLPGGRQGQGEGEGRERGGRGEGQPGQPQPPAPSAVVVPEPRTNSIVIRGSERNLDLIEQLVALLDTRATNAGEVRVFTLRNTQAEEVASNLQSMLGRSGAAPSRSQRTVLLRERLEQAVEAKPDDEGVVDMNTVISIAANKQTNSVIVAAPQEAMRIVEQVIMELDQSAAVASTPSVRLYELKNSDAATFVPMLRELLAPLNKSGEGSTSGVVVTADPGANLLIVSASPDRQEMIEKVIRDLDAAQPGDKLSIRVYPVQHANAPSVANTLREVLSPNPQSNQRNISGIQFLGRSLPIGPATSGSALRIISDDSSNSLLVRATDDDHVKITELLAQLDQPASLQQQVRVIPLKNIDADKAAQTLARMFDLPVAGPGGRRTRQALGQPSGPQGIVIEPDRDARMLLVRSDEETFARIEQIALQIDVPTAGGDVMRRVIALEHGDAPSVAEALVEAFTPADGSQPAPEERITVVAEEGSNSIVVTANQSMQAKVDGLLEGLDADTGAGMTTEFLVLDNADAAQMGPALTRIAAGDGSAGKRVATISSDATANALIFRGPTDEVARLRKIAGELDFEAGAFKMPDIGFFVLPVKNSDATQLAALVQDLFSQTAQQALLTGGGGGVGDMPTLSVTADPRSNSLIVITKPMFMVELRQLVDQLDGMTPKRGQLRVLTLQHADPRDLQRAIEVIYGTPTQQQSQQPPAGMQQPGMQQQQQFPQQQFPQQQIPQQQFPQQQFPRGQFPQQTNPQQPGGQQQRNRGNRNRNSNQPNQAVPSRGGFPRGMMPGGGASLDRSDANLVYVNFFQPVPEPAQPQPAAGNDTVIGFSGDRVSATALPQQHAILIDASDEDFEAIQKLAEMMDAAAAGTMKQFHVHVMKHVNNQRMADALNELYNSAARAGNDDDSVTLTPLDGTDALILAAVADKLPEVVALVEQLDVPGGTVGSVVRIIALEHSDASRVKTVIDALYAENAESLPSTDRPTIAVDSRTNSLVVSASEKTFIVLEALLRKIDSPMADPSVQLAVIPLKQNDAGVIAPAIQRLFDARLQSMTAQGETPAPKDRVAIETDALSNAMIISANKENLALIRELVAKLDIEPPIEGGVIRLYPLVNTEATRVAAVLKSLISQGLYKPGTVATQNNAALAAREQVAIETDMRTNTLIVSASQENFAIIEKIIEKLDTDAVEGEFADIRLFPLKFADAELLAPTLQGFFDSKRTGEQEVQGEAGTPTLPVHVTADPRTNTLLVTGGKDAFATIDGMLKLLDNESVATAGEFRIFHLQHATATALQPTIQQLFDQRVSRGVSQDSVTVLADAPANALIIGAKAADMVLVESLLAKLDAEPSDPTSIVRVIPLKKANAAEIAATLNNLYSSQTGTTGEPVVSIAVDERLNALVVSAGPTDLKRIEDVANQLDGTGVEQITEIRLFPLKHADAEELATILTTILTEKPTDPNDPEASKRRQTLLQLTTLDPQGRELISRALQEGVMITPERRTNQIVVSAPLDYMPMLSRLIDKFDSTSPREATIEVFNLANSDATQMADVLTQLFKLQPTGDGTNADDRAVQYTLVTGAGDGASAVLGNSEKQALSVTVDTRTNALLVGGTEKYVALAAQLIRTLDASPAQERTTKIYRLKHAQAPDIQTALDTFLTQENQRIADALGEDKLGAAQRLLERQVAVVAEEASNSLLISASPRFFETLDDMINALDAPKPQVLIQATLAEVTLGDGKELGFEWAYGGSIGGAEVEGGTNFGVPDGLNGLGEGMGVFVTAGDFRYALRALQSQQKVEILSRPQILASDNQPATINVGQRVPFVTESRVTEQGNTVNTIQYEDVGVILEVTARMTEEGFIQMDIHPEISDIAPATIQISDNLNAIVINTREADTTVTVKDGHTIVLGGLIRSNDKKTEKQVPILGDIPLIGNLFKSTKTERDRTELLIILTPHVIRSPEEADRITREQQKKLEEFRNADPRDLKKILRQRPEEENPEESFLIPAGA